MERQYYLDLAQAGLRMPIGTDLVLREKPGHELALLDGVALGRVVEETARRYETPLAIPLMDLMVEKQALAAALGVPADSADTYHFDSCPPVDVADQVAVGLQSATSPRLQANVDAVRYIAASTDLMAIGMCIGPFSLTSKLLADPILPVYMAGTGATGETDPDVLVLERALEAATTMCLHSCRLQIEAGARAVMIAEPAANRVFFSPRQLERGSDVFERMVMEPNRRIAAMLRDAGADLLFHSCGELVDAMLIAFAGLDPAVLSLGSSRNLWDDAAIVPERTVLYGNLPTKRFYSSELSVDEVTAMAQGLAARMANVGRPFILGSECDVLSVPGKHGEISAKVDAFMGCCGGH